MSETKNLYTKLAKVKSNLKIKKELENSYAGFKYASLDSILEQVNKELEREGLVFNILEYNDSGDRNYEVKAVLTDGDKEINFNYKLHGAVITTKSKAENFENFVYKIQDGGSAITYITRYVYGLVFSIPFEEDSIQKNTGNQNYKPAASQKPAVGEITWLTEAQLKATLQAPIEQAKNVLKTYSTATKKMKREYREQITNYINKGVELNDVIPD